jgi:hypothetical protein
MMVEPRPTLDEIFGRTTPAPTLKQERPSLDDIFGAPVERDEEAELIKLHQQAVVESVTPAPEEIKQRAAERMTEAALPPPELERTREEYLRSLQEPELLAGTEDVTYPAPRPGLEEMEIEATKRRKADLMQGVKEWALSDPDWGQRTAQQKKEALSDYYDTNIGGQYETLPEDKRKEIKKSFVDTHMAYLTSPSRGLTYDIAANWVVGAFHDTAKMLIEADQYIARKGPVITTMEIDALPEIDIHTPLIKEMEKDYERYDILKPSQEAMESEARRIVTQGGRMIIPSTLPWLVGGPIGGWLGMGTSALVSAGVFGGAQGNQLLREGVEALPEINAEREAKGLPPITARDIEDAAWKSAKIEGGAEAASNAIAGGIFGVYGKLFRAAGGSVAIQPAKGSVKDMLATPIKKTVGRQLMDLPFELTTEGYQAYKEVEIRQGLGLKPGVTKEEAVWDVMGPTAFMTLLMGGGAHSFNYIQVRSIRNALVDPRANKEERMEAAQLIAREINARNPEYGQIWLDRAAKEIEDGKSINIENPIVTKYYSDVIGEGVDEGTISIEAVKTKEAELSQAMPDSVVTAMLGKHVAEDKIANIETQGKDVTPAGEETKDRSEERIKEADKQIAKKEAAVQEAIQSEHQVFLADLDKAVAEGRLTFDELDGLKKSIAEKETDKEYLKTIHGEMDKIKEKYREGAYEARVVRPERERKEARRPVPVRGRGRPAAPPGREVQAHERERELAEARRRKVEEAEVKKPVFSTVTLKRNIKDVRKQLVQARTPEERTAISEQLKTLETLRDIPPKPGREWQSSLVVHFAPITSKLKAGPRFNIVSSATELPTTIQKKIADVGTVRGVFDADTGTVHLVAENIKDVADAERAYVHEVFGHYGPETYLGETKKVKSFYGEMYAYRRADVDAVATKLGIDITTPEGKRKASREWLAEKVESGEYKTDRTIRTWWNRFVRLFNEGLRKIGIKRALSDSEIADVVLRGKRRIERGPEVVTIRPEDKATRETYSFSVAVNTPIRSAIAQIKNNPAFKKWFAGSKVVDKKGNPRVLYHGTPAFGFEEFDVKFQREKSLFGPGFYFSHDERMARTYAQRGGDVYPVYVRITRPFDAWKFYTLDESINLAQELFHDKPALLSQIVENFEGLQFGEQGYLPKPYDIIDKGGISGWDIYDVFTKEASPIRADIVGEDVVDTPDAHRFVNEMFKRAGYDGVLYEGGHVVGPAMHEAFVAFDPEQVKSIYNTGEFTESPNIYYSITEAEKLANSYQALVDEKEKFKGFDLPSVALSRSIRIGLQDHFIAVRAAQQAVLEHVGKTKYGEAGGRSSIEIKEEFDAYHKEERMKGKTGTRIREFYKDHVDPLKEKIKKYKFTLPEVDEYLYAKHASERNARIAKINPRFADVEKNPGSGMSNGRSKTILDSYEGDAKKHMEDIAKDLYAINKLRRKILKEAGLVSAEELEAWETGGETGVQWNYYMPMRRDFGDNSGYIRTGKGLDIRGKETKRSLGGESLASDLVLNSVAMAEEAIVRAEKNAVGQTFLNFVREFPAKHLWEINKVELSPHIDKRTGQVRYGYDPTHKLKDNVLSVKENGKEIYITIHDDTSGGKALARAMKNLGAERSRVVVQYFGAVTRWLAKMRTQYSPEFPAFNFIRDITEGVLNITAHQSVGMAARTVWHTPVALIGSYRAIRGHKEAGMWGERYKQWERAGGKTGYFVLERMESRRKKMLKDLSRVGRGGSVKEAASSMAQFIADINEVVESGVRLSSFNQMLEAGYSVGRAASFSKNLTVNFDRKGERGSDINSFFMFYNAGIQGSATLMRALSTTKGKAVVATPIVASGILMSELNRLIGGEDEDGESYYDKLEDWKKENNFIIMLPGSSPKGIKAIMVPLPYGYNIFYVAGTIISDTLHGRDPAESAMRFLGAMLDAFNPVGGESGRTKTQTLFMNATPSIFDPFLQWSYKTTFYGTPLKPEAPQYGKGATPESQLYFSTVNPLSKAMAQKINEMTGGSAARPGKVDISPEMIDHFASFMTGGPGAFMGRMGGIISDIVKGERTPIRRIPFARRVLGELPEWETSQEYYELKTEIETSVNEFELFEKAGETESVKAVEKKYGRIINLVPEMQRTEKTLRDLRDQKKDVEAADITDETKRSRTEVLDDQIQKAQKQFIRQYNKALESPAQEVIYSRYRLNKVSVRDAGEKHPLWKEFNDTNDQIRGHEAEAEMLRSKQSEFGGKTTNKPYTDKTSAGIKARKKEALRAFGKGNVRMKKLGKDQYVIMVTRQPADDVRKNRINNREAAVESLMKQFNKKHAEVVK